MKKLFLIFAVALIMNSFTAFAIPSPAESLASCDNEDHDLVTWVGAEGVYYPNGVNATMTGSVGIQDLSYHSFDIRDECASGTIYKIREYYCNQSSSYHYNFVEVACPSGTTCLSLRYNTWDMANLGWNDYTQVWDNSGNGHYLGVLGAACGTWAANLCADSDGYAPQTSGNVSWGNLEWADMCSPQSSDDRKFILMEWGCNGLYIPTYNKVNCSTQCANCYCHNVVADANGNVITSAKCAPNACNDGNIEPSEVCDGTNLNGQTCASQTQGALPLGTLNCGASCTSFDISECEPLAPSPCSDSDGGIRPFQKGTAVNGTASETDSCFNSSSVNEFYCSGAQVVKSLQSCPEYAICSDGVCTYYCNDSDNGYNIWQKGTTTNGSATKVDYCTPEYHYLVEYYCVSPNGISGGSIDCAQYDSYCNDGACIPEFTAIGAGIALIGAGAGYLFIRRRKNN